jgi:pyruvate/2-oxoglutarate dehydrogenase complex dihydrolipoamide dehydrogenase (E3) component
MKDTLHYDNLIIGFGKGGKTLATYLAKQGKQVALVERSERMYGGTCINVACIPTKSLITNAEKQWPYERAFVEKNHLTSKLRKSNFDKINDLSLATVITGEASFISPHEVSIKTDGGRDEMIVHADRIFINTGSQPYVPPIAGVGFSKKTFTSTSLMEESTMVKKLIIIGGGFIGLEFADMYAKFGAQVTVLDQQEDFLPKVDGDIADEIYKVITEKGIKIVNQAAVEHIQDTYTGVTVSYHNREGDRIDVEASAVLLATGRRPVVENLNLTAAGIQTDERGYVKVNESLKTNVDHIWAIGDINGGPQFTYISLDDFRIIRDQLSGGSYTSVKQRKEVAFSMFTTPPLAHIGLREEDAREQGYSIKVATLAAANIPRAKILNSTEGLLKTVVDSKTLKILGCTLFCAEANEMINTVQIAMNAGLDYRAVRDSIYTHPSMTEAFNDLYGMI